MLMTIQQRQLIHEHTTQSESSGGDQSFGGYLGVSVEDAFEMFVEVLYRKRTQFVEDATYFPACIILGSPSTMSSHQPPLLEHTHSPEQRRVVMLVSQQVTHISRQLTFTSQPVSDDQLGGFGAVIMVGRRKVCSQGYPDRGDYGNQVKFPPIYPPVPPGFGPVTLCINRGMRHFSCCSMLLVPHPTTRTQHRTISSNRSSTLLPRLNKSHKMTSQSSNLSRQSIRNGSKASLPGSSGGVASILGEEQSQCLHLRGRLG